MVYKFHTNTNYLHSAFWFLIVVWLKSVDIAYETQQSTQTPYGSKEESS